VPTENSVRINQHPCGTLIADLVCAVKRRWSTAGVYPPGNWFANPHIRFDERGVKTEAWSSS